MRKCLPTIELSSYASYLWPPAATTTNPRPLGSEGLNKAGRRRSQGQSNYAAANAALDSAAVELLGQGTPARSVQWGEWGGGGMASAGATASAAHARARHTVGMGVLSPVRKGSWYQKK
eukprot:5486405-Pyramimonas_sp.AAC.1